jgi:hypothetical protein
VIHYKNADEMTMDWGRRVGGWREKSVDQGVGWGKRKRKRK